MFILQEQTINPIQAKAAITDSLNGAFVSFEGIVRSDQYDKTKVNSLLYIANAEECIKEGENIVQEALKLFPINTALCIQRIGNVKVGETATWIGVWASHRDEAFKACRFIIEETKTRLLIWKKEYYNDGTNRWIQGQEVPVIL